MLHNLTACLESQAVTNFCRTVAPLAETQLVLRMLYIFNTNSSLLDDEATRVILHLSPLFYFKCMFSLRFTCLCEDEELHRRLTHKDTQPSAPALEGVAVLFPGGCPMIALHVPPLSVEQPPCLSLRPMTDVTS